jgi:hypothetical protein
LQFPPKAADPATPDAPHVGQLDLGVIAVVNFGSNHTQTVTLYRRQVSRNLSDDQTIPGELLVKRGFDALPIARGEQIQQGTAQ